MLPGSSLNGGWLSGNRSARQRGTIARLAAVGFPVFNPAVMSHAVGHLPLVIQRADILSPPAPALIEALNAELTARYPEPGACHFRLEAPEVADGHGAFLIAFRSGHAVGCGAIRRIAPQAGEIKRMYMVPPERGRGVGRAILSALEAEARALNLTRLVLETGVRQEAAQALYQRAGFAVVPPFGEYTSSPLSVCLAKQL